MIRRPFLAWLIFVFAPIGCLSEKDDQTRGFFSRMSPFRGPVGPDVVLMDVAIVERPVGDSYLNDGVWRFTDEQTISLEQKVVLEENGLRVGVIAGATPAGLQELLVSEKSCSAPQSYVRHAGKPISLSIGKPIKPCRFQIHEGSTVKTADFGKGEFALLIEPRLGSDGGVKLHCTPEIVHGEAKQVPRLTEDQSALALKPERPTEKYSSLSWEVSIGPNQYLVAGGRYDRTQTIGAECFIRTREQAPVQRLIVIRAWRQDMGQWVDDPAAGPEFTSKRSNLPLAMQAASAAP